MERVDLEEVAIIRFAPGLETRILILIKVRLAKTSNLPKASAFTNSPSHPTGLVFVIQRSGCSRRSG
jgi:hypothetical protein